MSALGDDKETKMNTPQKRPGFHRDESGATAIEYGLIVALIFLAIITAVKSVAARNNIMYSTIQSNLSNP